MVTVSEMAQVLISDVDVQDEVQEERGDDTDSLSSDSDAGPVIKKKRSTQTVRQRSKPLLEEADETQPVSIYCGKVPTSLPATLSREMCEQLEKDSDGEEDQTSTRRRRKSSGQTRSRRNEKPAGRLRRGRSEAQSQTESSISCTVLSSDDEDLQTVGSQGSHKGSGRERSPTPPPTVPDHLYEPRRRRKQPRAVKEAIRNLDILKGQIVLSSRGIVIGQPHLDDSVTAESPSPVKTLNREIMVKVRSRSGIQRFPMKMSDYFGDILKQMARHEFVSEERVVMFLNDHTIQPYDSPASLNLHVADIIDCHIQREGEVTPAGQQDDADLLEEGPDHVQVKVQGKDPKSQMMMSIHKAEPLEKILRLYAQRQKKSYEDLIFQFDGEHLKGQETAESLDIEDYDCIDVIEM